MANLSVRDEVVERIPINPNHLINLKKKKMKNNQRVVREERKEEPNLPTLPLDLYSRARKSTFLP